MIPKTVEASLVRWHRVYRHGLRRSSAWQIIDCVLLVQQFVPDTPAEETRRMISFSEMKPGVSGESAAPPAAALARRRGCRAVQRSMPSSSGWL